MTDRTEHSDVHSDACRGLRCPCYVEGQRDLLEVLRVAERLGADIVEPVRDAVARGAIPRDPGRSA